MKNSFIFYLVLIFLISSIFSCNDNRQVQKSPAAINGVIDLRSYDLNTDELIKLDGEWEMYWEEFYDHDDFAENRVDNSKKHLSPFKQWNSNIINDKQIGSKGFATYRLRVLVNHTDIPLALQINPIETAYELEINGEIKKVIGTIGKSAESSIPNPLEVFVPIDPVSENLEILLRISNFHHRAGGPWNSIQIGNIDSISKYFDRERQSVFFMFGAFIIMSISYLSLYLSGTKEKIYQFFSLFCLVLTVRVLVQNGGDYLLQIFPDISWRIRFGLEYTTVYAGVVFFMCFIHSFFHELWFEYELRITGIIGSLLSLSAFILPTFLNSWFITFFQGFLLIAGVQITIILVKNVIKKDKFAVILLSGGTLLFITVINDVLFAKGIIESVFLLQYGMLFFILFQDFVLSVKMSDSNIMISRQRRQLVNTNNEYLKEIERGLVIADELKQSNQNLIMARSAIINGLAKIAEHRDPDTGAHLSRIQEFNSLLATELANKTLYRNYITDEYFEDLYLSSMLHDIGKVGIPDSILLKPGKLTADEFSLIKTHTLIGGDTIASIEKNVNVQTFLTLAKDIAYMHHEKWDGSGYPYGMKGREIPLSARITAISDVYDALTSKRKYKEAFTHEKAVNIITSERGKHFDPDIIDCFITVKEKFNKLKHEIS